MEGLKYFAHIDENTAELLGYYNTLSHVVPRNVIELTYDEWQAALAINANKLESGQLVYQPKAPDNDTLIFIQRQWRNSELRNTDHYLMSDYPITGQERVEVTQYRQALRDYPNDSVPASEWVKPPKPDVLKDMVD